MNFVRILLLEDNELDAELALARLSEGGITHQTVRVQTEADFRAALTTYCPDLILADYSLPGFDGFKALQLAQQICPDVPFVFVSGALGEELAVETLTSGATDYVLKHRLERLVPAVRRALRLAEERAERRRAEAALRESEERFRLLVDSTPDYAIISLDPEGRVRAWNRGAERTLGYRADEILGRHYSCFFIPEDIAAGVPEQELQKAAATGRVEDERWHVRKDGGRFWASGATTPLRDEAGRLKGFAKIFRDLSERKQLEEALRQRAEELAEAHRRKDEFLAMLGHELRNPLAPIRNAIQLMQLRQGLEDPQLHWARDVVNRQVQHMTRLVDDLLDLSRITRGKLQLQKEPLDLTAVVAGAAETVRPLMEDRRHQFEVSLPDEPLRVEGDATRLQQVLVNLLNNAAKYTEEGGRVWLSAERVDRNPQPPEVVLRVRDTGMGIPPDLLPRVFELFAQADQAVVQSPGGLGIGLSLVRRLVELHGGTVEAHSAGERQGSEFVVRLPALSEARAGAPGEAPAPEAEPSAAPAGRRPVRVLVVDDNRDASTSLAMLLRLLGHEVHVAHDGPSALEQGRSLRPDVVLCDIELPGMNGYEVARRLRQLPELTGALLVALTGFGQEDDRRLSREAGFDRHLVKPADLDDLQQLLAQADVARGDAVQAG